MGWTTAAAQSPHNGAQTPVRQRDGVDRCPGMLMPFLADDGAVIRLRIPGGRVRVAVLAALADLARAHGAPVLTLTSRGNLQLRALPDPLPAALIERVEALGLLPSATHERVRNIVAAPQARELDAVVSELDQELCADPALARLPGRFLWAISDAHGSILSTPWDLAYQELDPGGGRGLVLLAQHAVPVRRADAVRTLIDFAHRFLGVRCGDREWNVRDLPADSPLFTGTVPRPPKPAAPPLEPGCHGSDLVAAVPLGLLDAVQIAVLGEVTDHVTVTPWRSLLIPDGAAAVNILREKGFVVDADESWSRLSACVGAPYCRRTTSPTMELARAAAPSLTGSGPRLHVAGCARGCGAPTAKHRLVVDPQSVEPILAAAKDPQ